MSGSDEGGNIRPRVFFAVPSYDNKLCAEFVHSMTDTLALLEHMGIDATVEYHGKDCYIHRARNTLCRQFLASGASDLFFVDADMGWDFRAPARLLARPYEFVGGVYPFKIDDEGYPVSIRTDAEGRPVVAPVTGCIAATMLPTGFWRLRRSVLEKMEAHCDWYMDKDQRTTAFFETPIVNHEWIGEDCWFCRKWLSLAGEIWLDPNIDFQHVGAKSWRGNYHQFLMRCPGGSEDGGSESS